MGKTKTQIAIIIILRKLMTNASLFKFVLLNRYTNLFIKNSDIVLKHLYVKCWNEQGCLGF